MANLEEIAQSLIQQLVAEHERRRIETAASNRQLEADKHEKGFQVLKSFANRFDLSQPVHEPDSAPYLTTDNFTLFYEAHQESGGMVNLKLRGDYNLSPDQDSLIAKLPVDAIMGSPDLVRVNFFFNSNLKKTDPPTPDEQNSIRVAFTLLYEMRDKWLKLVEMAKNAPEIPAPDETPQDSDLTPESAALRRIVAEVNQFEDFVSEVEDETPSQLADSVIGIITRWRNDSARLSQLRRLIKGE